ncbi:MAG TPA: DNA-processing protein DprA [Pseudonocardiaceae bacterium]|jgi:DNA processing protein|nr:DNA-processing protein DprA [Pseudonocardiaceae bacterium]
MSAISSALNRPDHPTTADTSPTRSSATTQPAPRPQEANHHVPDIGDADEPTNRTTTSAADLDAVRLARAYLLRVAEPPAPALAAFVATVGAVTAAELVRAGTAPPAVLDVTVARKEIDLAEEDLVAAAGVGARLLIPEDDEWPAWPFVALDLASARGVRWAGHPIALWARGTGHLGEFTERAVAVVGARAATGYGDHLATEFGYELAGNGLTVVSGAAYGIDGAAHRGAIAAGGRTIAVLGCGVDQPYPLGHATLLDTIAEHGLVLSEYPPATPPARHRFLVRNRLIAASAAGTVVIEAGRRSGARNTAATAQALGRVVLAVPGPVTSAMSVGCHELLRSGDAYLVSNAAEVMESIGPVGIDLVEPVRAETRPTDRLDDQQLRVHEALSRSEALSPEQISAGSGVPLERVRAALPLLELVDLAEHTESGWRQLTRGKRGEETMR